MSYLQAALMRSRTTLCVMVMVMCVGLYARQYIPVEINPKVSVPFVSVTLIHEGISPEDGARLIGAPMEDELKSIEGVVEVNSYSAENVVTMIVKFSSDIEMETALEDVRESVDRAKSDIPGDTEEAIIKEVAATNPMMIVSIIGDGASERVLRRVGRQLQDEIEAIPEVREAVLAGVREEVLEAVVDVAKMEAYAVTHNELLAAVTNNNRLIPAGALDMGSGRFSVKVPGLIETHEDVYNLPLKATSEGVVTLSDVAEIRRTFKAADSYTSSNGQLAASLEVWMRFGGNEVELAHTIYDVVNGMSGGLPDGVEVKFNFDQAPYTLQMVTELEGNIVTAMVLVMTIVVAALGVRSGILVGLGVPVSLFFALMIIHAIGHTFNFMVMFGMLLALGMLIDGSIVITEYADRKMSEGMSPREAYVHAVERMFWPVVASICTTLAAFLPLMFWPGITGDFMFYLPVAVFAVLIGSLFYALCFAPVLGAYFGKAGAMDEKTLGYLCALESMDVLKLKGLTGSYARSLRRTINYPLWALSFAAVCLISIIWAYGEFNRGTIYFAETQPSHATGAVRARGNLSAEEKRQLVDDVVQTLLSIDGVQSVYTRTKSSTSSSMGFNKAAGPADEIGNLFIELTDASQRELSGLEVLAQARSAVAEIPGIRVSINKIESGPPIGKEIQLQLSSRYHDDLAQATGLLRHYMENEIQGLTDVEDTRPLPGIEWQLAVDRRQAAHYGADVTAVGATVQMVTDGLLVGDYRPDDADEEIDIRVRYPLAARDIDHLDALRVATPQGLVPISNFVSLEAQPSVNMIHRIDGEQVMFIRANTDLNVLADDLVQQVQQWVAAGNLPASVSIEFRGANEEQEKAQDYLSGAFSLALFLMAMLLVTQFNSFYQTILILSAVILSTIGVLFGLLVTGQPFSTVMTGVGIVALAGIVVNNNIVLIDTYNYVRKEHPELTSADAVVLASAQRLRPVFLTTATTVLGLMPIATQLSIDFINRSIIFDGVISAFFAQLASSIVNGLIFSTVLTLFVTPLFLCLPEALGNHYKRLRGKSHSDSKPVQTDMASYRLDTVESGGIEENPSVNSAVDNNPETAVN